MSQQRYMDPIFDITEQLKNIGATMEGMMVELQGVDTNIMGLYAKDKPDPKQMRGYGKLKVIHDRWSRRVAWLKSMKDKNGSWNELAEPYYKDNPEEWGDAIRTYNKGLNSLEGFLKRGGESFHPHRKGIRPLLTPWATGDSTQEVTLHPEKQIENVRDALGKTIERLKAVGQKTKELGQKIRGEED